MTGGVEISVNGETGERRSTPRGKMSKINSGVSLIKDRKVIKLETKEERIQKELDRISQVFESVPDNERTVIDPLLQNCAFMKVTLEDLQEEINRDGVSESYQNGANQSGQKENSRLKSYNRLIKNFESVTKTVMKYLPEDARLNRQNDPMERLLSIVENGGRYDPEEDSEEDLS